MSKPVRVLAWPARRKRSENPYSFLLQQSTAPFGVQTEEFNARNLLSSRWDVIHVHWPDIFLNRKGALLVAGACCLILLVLSVHKLLGSKLVWTVHNLEAHERRYPRIGDWYMKRFVAMVDGIMSPSQYSLDAICQIHPTLQGKPSVVSRIGVYSGEYADAMESAVAKTQLNLDTNSLVLLSFGQIRPYKNIPHLIRVFKACNFNDVILVVAGSCSDKVEKQQILDAAATSEPTSETADAANIRLVTEFVPDKLIPVYFSAADAVVLPFKSILNSSSAILATYDVPVLVPSIGAMPELVDSVGEHWIHTYQPELDQHMLVEFVNAMRSRAANSAPAANTTRVEKPDLSDFSWDEIGLETANYFKSMYR